MSAGASNDDRARMAPCPCGSGKRYKRCCLARDRAHDGAIEASRIAHEVIDGVLRVVLPLVESRGEHTIACHAGCNHCCSHFIRTSYAEALQIAAWLSEPAHESILKGFESRLPSWREAVGAEARALDAMLKKSRGVPPEGAEGERYRETVVAYTTRHRMCPFNNEDGRCSIYDIRPVPCRVWHVLGASEHCRPGSERLPDVLQHPSIDGAVGDVQEILEKATEQAVGEGQSGTLPEMVVGALGRLNGG